MSHQLILSVRHNNASNAKEPGLCGKYRIRLRADTPESCLAAAAQDTLMRFYPIKNGESFSITARDSNGHIVLDTEMPEMGSMAHYGLSAQLLESS